MTVMTDAIEVGHFSPSPPPSQSCSAMSPVQLVRTVPIAYRASPAPMVCSTILPPASCPAPILVQAGPGRWSVASQSRLSPPPLLPAESVLSPSPSSSDITQPPRPVSSCSPPPLTASCPPPLSPYVMVRLVPIATAPPAVASYTASPSSLSSVECPDVKPVPVRAVRTNSLGNPMVTIPPLVSRNCRSASDIDCMDMSTCDSASSEEMDVENVDNTCTTPPPLSPCTHSSHRSSSSSQILGKSRKNTPRRKRGPYQHFSRSQRMEIAEFAAVHGSTCAARHFTQRYNRPVKRSTIDSMVANLRARRSFSTSEST